MFMFREWARWKATSQEAGDRAIPRPFQRLAFVCGSIAILMLIFPVVGEFFNIPIKVTLPIALHLAVYFAVVWALFGAIDWVVTFALVQIDRRVNRDAPLHVYQAGVAGDAPVRMHPSSDDNT